MIFLALISCAEIYRREYIDEEVKANKTLCEEMGNAVINDPKKKVTTPARIKKVQLKAAGMHHKYRHSVEKFDKVVGDEIKAVREAFKITDEKSFQAYLAGFGSVIEQYLNAKDTGEIIAVCQAYNAGLLDEVLKVLQAEQVEAKEEFLNKVEGIGKDAGEA